MAQRNGTGFILLLFAWGGLSLILPPELKKFVLLTFCSLGRFPSLCLPPGDGCLHLSLPGAVSPCSPPPQSFSHLRWRRATIKKCFLSTVPLPKAHAPAILQLCLRFGCSAATMLCIGLVQSSSAPCCWAGFGTPPPRGYQGAGGKQLVRGQP